MRREHGRRQGTPAHAPCFQAAEEPAALFLKSPHSRQSKPWKWRPSQEGHRRRTQRSSRALPLTGLGRLKSALTAKARLHKPLPRVSRVLMMIMVRALFPFSTNIHSRLSMHHSIFGVSCCYCCCSCCRLCLLCCLLCCLLLFDKLYWCYI